MTVTLIQHTSQIKSEHVQSHKETAPPYCLQLRMWNSVNLASMSLNMLTVCFSIVHTLSTSPTFQKPFSFSLSLPFSFSPSLPPPFLSHPSTICCVLCQTLEIQRCIQRIDSLHLTILVTSCAPAVLSSEIQTTIGFCLQPLDLFACVLDCPVFFCSFPVCPVSASSLSDKPEAFLTEHFLPEWFQGCSLTNTRQHHGLMDSWSRRTMGKRYHWLTMQHSACG